MQHLNYVRILTRLHLNVYTKTLCPSFKNINSVAATYETKTTIVFSVTLHNFFSIYLAILGTQKINTYNIHLLQYFGFGN